MIRRAALVAAAALAVLCFLVALLGLATGGPTLGDLILFLLGAFFYWVADRPW